jgi:hypothetical protein
VTVVPFDKGAPVAAFGFLGLTPKIIEVDFVHVSQYGPCVFVEPRGAAWKAGLRPGDFVTSINDQTFEAFHAEIPPAGTQFRIVAYRKGVGVIRTFGILGFPPRSKPQAEWMRTRGVLPGDVVKRAERSKYLDLVSKHPSLTDRDVRLLTILVNMEWHRGIIPAHATIAKKMRCHRSTVKRSIARTQHFGFLRIISGKQSHTTNSYQVCWPVGSR